MRVNVEAHACFGCREHDPQKGNYVPRRIEGVLYFFHEACAPVEEKEKLIAEVSHSIFHSVAA